jgi:hypothetical protein
MRLLLVVALGLGLVVSSRAAAGDALRPGTRVLLDAHNAYPEHGRWADRLDRALATGLPVAIEQDLVWAVDSSTGRGHSVVSHGAPLTGGEPTLESYFFDRIGPLLEQAVRENRRDTWPLFVLNLDFKSNEPEHHRAVWDILARYAPWLSTAERRATPGEAAPITAGPLLVLTGSAPEQETTFHDRVPVGERLLLFGAVQSPAPGEPGPRTNYRRWWNNPWSVVEPEGQPEAGDWTTADDERLRVLVQRAHAAELWTRFYTLNGHHPADVSGGWTPSYNFGSRRAVEQRWAAAIRAGVDFVAVDQYDAFAEVARRAASRDEVRFDGELTRADYERLFEHEFDVPAGVERVEIELSYDTEQRTVVDLGLRGAAGFRGWSGGGPQRVFVASHAASFGYTPGAIEPGRWAVILGVPNVREGVRAKYTVRVRLATGAIGWPTLRTTPGWYAGDLHAHSGHSDGRTLGLDGERTRVPPQRVFDAARAARLDFVALTEHNTASHWADVDRLQGLYPDVLLLHGREITTYRGHMNAFGERRFVDFRLGAGRSVRDLAAELTGGGAFVSINHPLRADDESCMGCGWNDRDEGTIGAVQAVEIVNGDVREGPIAGWPFWAGLLNRGHRLTAIGGSDEHSPDEGTDGRLGRPTTVVYASELSEDAILSGMRAGRVYIRTRGVAGPRLEFTASAARIYQMGETAPPGPLLLQAAVAGAAGQRLEWMRNGAVMAAATLEEGDPLRYRIEAARGDWFSVVIRDAAGPTLFSNAIYVR